MKHGLLCTAGSKGLQKGFLHEGRGFTPCQLHPQMQKPREMRVRKHKRIPQ